MLVRGRILSQTTDGDIELGPVQPSGMRLIVQAGAADMGGRGVIEEFFFFCGVPVEPQKRLRCPKRGHRGRGTRGGRLVADSRFVSASLARRGLILSTSAGIRPRSLTAMTWSFAQARYHR